MAIKSRNPRASNHHEKQWGNEQIDSQTNKSRHIAHEPELTFRDPSIFGGGDSDEQTRESGRLKRHFRREMGERVERR
uniref:Uncharacterized protein n=1 Tax=Arundo donax TaxID=35708 RepID=A0A0A9CM85_ARUDO